NIGSVQVRKKRAILARVPTKDIQQAGDYVVLRAVHRRGGRPSRCLANIEPEHGANLFVDFQFTKIGCLLRPPESPVYAADEIAFMKTIPACCCNLHEQKPTKRCRQIRNREL